MDVAGGTPFALTPETVVEANFVGWSGLGPIAMLIEDVFGFDFDAPRNRITWDIRTSGRHGIENLLFNGGRVTLICSGLPDAEGEFSVTLTTDNEVALSVLVQGVSKREIVAKPGTHSLKINL
jgi:hypothetical protein